ncbi:MAG: metallophosphoesterase family protein [Anaerolineae bacterium]|nr:metallophosphoesterase family protein [Anaerolineae bacterium]
MTRIAIISDIHGNLPALEATMADLRRMSADQVIVNGDVINRGPQSAACLTAVRAMGWPVVFGNHEEYVLKMRSGDMPREWESDWWLPTRSAAESLSESDVAFLRGLPWHYVLAEPGLPPVRIVHGSPRRLNEGVGYWLSDADLCDLAAGVPEPVLVCAHTHRPFNRRVGERWFLNTGAVGAPFNGDPSAQYVLLTAHNGAWHADLRAVAYDRAPVYAAWEQAGYLHRSAIAHVFKYEVETATYHLGPYLEFCGANGLDERRLESFMQYRAAASHMPPGRTVKLRST